jgi:hypothetical protein
MGLCRLYSGTTTQSNIGDIMTNAEQLFTDLAMLDDFFCLLENLEHEIKAGDLTARRQKVLDALREFHTNWLKDE